MNEIAGAVHATDHGRLTHLLNVLRLAAEDHIRQENALLWEIRTGAHERALRSSKSAAQGDLPGAPLMSRP
jgi:hypothetical protein